MLKSMYILNYILVHVECLLYGMFPRTRECRSIQRNVSKFCFHEYIFSLLDAGIVMISTRNLLIRRTILKCVSGFES